MPHGFRGYTSRQRPGRQNSMSESLLERKHLQGEQTRISNCKGSLNRASCVTIYATMNRIATGQQLRAARNALGWSIEKLAKRSGVSVRTIIRYEKVDTVPATRSDNLQTLVQILESGGIEFIGTPDDRPGIRIHAKS